MQKNAPVFSIIVPIYNVEAYLSQCLDSLLAQTFQDFEIIAVDDVSTDSSRQIARSYAEQHPDKLQLIEHKDNTRQGGARNTGIAAARGKYLMFIDSDDYWKPDALEKVYAVIAKDDPDIIEFCMEYVDENGRHLWFTNSRPDVYSPSGRKRALLTHTASIIDKAVRAELFADPDVLFPEKYYYEDYFAIPKLLMGHHKIVALDAPLCCYRQRTGSTMHDTNIEKNNHIMIGTDDLLKYYRKNGFGQEIFEELEFFAINNVLYDATLRVNGIDRHSPLQKKLKAYMQENFPNYRSNPCTGTFTPKKKRLLKLIENEQYGLLYLYWHVRNRITGTIKRTLYALLGKR